MATLLRVVSLVALSLAGLVQQTSSSGRGAGHPAGSSSSWQPHVLQHCSVLLSGLSRHQRELLRDQAQAVPPRASRHLLGGVALQGAAPDVRAASHGRGGRRVAMDQQRQRRSAAAGGGLPPAYLRQVATLASLGAIPSGTNATVLAQCLLTHINPVLAGARGRPALSFMMQYYKRPLAAEPVVRSILACSSAIDLEVLINVDHPAEHKVSVTQHCCSVKCCAGGAGRPACVLRPCTCRSCDVACAAGCWEMNTCTAVVVAPAPRWFQCIDRERWLRCRPTCVPAHLCMYGTCSCGPSWLLSLEAGSWPRFQTTCTRSEATIAWRRWHGRRCWWSRR